MTPRFRVWDGKMMQAVRELRFGEGGTYWAALTSSGWSHVDASYKGWQDKAPREEGVLMQWTGLKDNKGIRIYDRDILKVVTHGDWGDDTTYTSLTEVVFERRPFGESEGSGWLYVPDNREVVGNVWENPTLLGSKP